MPQLFSYPNERPLISQICHKDYICEQLNFKDIPPSSNLAVVRKLEKGTDYMCLNKLRFPFTNVKSKIPELELWEIKTNTTFL